MATTIRANSDGATASSHNFLDNTKAKADTSTIMDLTRAKIVIKKFCELLLLDTFACIANVHAKTLAIAVVKYFDVDPALYGVVKRILH